MKDLFGHEIDEKAAIKKRKNTQANGYAMLPGTGPEGETCGTCEHHYVRVFGNRYHKCDFVKPSRSVRTDIRVRSPACAKWEKMKVDKD